MVQDTLIDLLLACLHWEPGRIDRAGLKRLDDDDWRALLALAAKQRVTALLFHRLQQRALLESVPAAFRECLRKTYRSNAFRNLWNVAEL